MSFNKATLDEICKKIKDNNGFINSPTITYLRELDEEEFKMLNGE